MTRNPVREASLALLCVALLSTASIAWAHVAEHRAGLSGSKVVLDE